MYILDGDSKRLIAGIIQARERGPAIIVGMPVALYLT